MWGHRTSSRTGCPAVAPDSASQVASQVNDSARRTRLDAKGAAPVGCVQKATQHRGQGRGVVPRDEETVGAQHLRASAGGRGHHRDPGRQPFEGGQPERLVPPGRDHVDVSLTEGGWDLGPHHMAPRPHVDPTSAQIGHQLVDQHPSRRPRRPTPVGVAHQVHGELSPLVGQRQTGSEQRVGRFLHADPSDEPNYRNLAGSAGPPGGERIRVNAREDHRHTEGIEAVGGLDGTGQVGADRHRPQPVGGPEPASYRGPR